MAISVPISVQAGRLQRYGIDENLKDDFDHIKNKCKARLIDIKSNKARLSALKNNYKADKLREKSKGVTLSPKEIMKRRANKRDLRAMKNRIKQVEYEIKLQKIEYKKAIAQRKAIRGQIKTKYEANKDKIKEVKQDRMQARRDKFIKMGVDVRDKVVDLKNKAVDVKDKVVDVKDKAVDTVETIKEKIQEKFIPKSDEEGR